MAVNDTLALRKKQAEKLVSEIEDELKLISSFKTSAKMLIADISTDNKKYKKTTSSLNLISSNIQKSIVKFNSEKSKINRLLTQADRFYEKQYLPLKQKIENPDTGLKSKIKDHETLSRKLKAVESDCEKKYSEVKTIIFDFKKVTKELKVLDVSIRNLHSSSSKNKLATETRLTEIIKLEKKSITLNSNILKLEEKSSSLFESIKNSEKDSKIKLTKIESNLTTAKEALKEIQGVYNLAFETGRSGEFKNRSKMFKIEVEKWEGRVLVTSIFLLLSVIALFVFQLYLLDWKIKILEINFYLRFILLSPLVYHLFFCASQHNKVQKLYDKYSFKTTLAMSIRHHIELLVKQDLFVQKGQIEKVLDFVLDAFSKIYNEPYSTDDYKMKIKLANVELELEKKINEVLKSKTKLKESKSED